MVALREDVLQIKTAEYLPVEQLQEQEDADVGGNSHSFII
jgi:hypothetical protein